MATPTVYVLCDANCKWEGMTKEQILTAITQAVNEGTISNIDTGFVQTIKTITGTALKFFVGTQAEYNALTAAQKQNLFALITNDTTKEGLLAAIEELRTEQGELRTAQRELREELINGSVVVGKAKNATNADASAKIKGSTSSFTITTGSYVGDTVFVRGKTYICLAKIQKDEYSHTSYTFIVGIQGDTSIKSVTSTRSGCYELQVGLSSETRQIVSLVDFTDPVGRLFAGSAVTVYYKELFAETL